MQFAAGKPFPRHRGPIWRRRNIIPPTRDSIQPSRGGFSARENGQKSGHRKHFGKETLGTVAFFGAAMFTQNFDNVVTPRKSHTLGTQN